MVDQRLLDYIKKQLAAGYKPDAVRNYLVNYGYNAADIDEAMRAAGAPGAKPAAGKKIPLVPIIGGMLAVLVIAVFFIIFLTGEKEEAVIKEAKALNVELTVTMISSNIRQGDDARFSIILANKDGKTRDIGLIYQVVDKEGAAINQKEDFVSVTHLYFGEKNIEVADDAKPGKYSLAVTGHFDGEEVKKTFEFGVLAASAISKIIGGAEAEETKCPASCDDDDPCTDDQCSAATNYQCAHFAVVPCCGNLRCESYENYDNCPTDCTPTRPAAAGEITLGEITENAKNYAATSLEQADSYCKSLPEFSQRDSCFFIVANTAKQSSFCTPIFSELKRDNCYSDFALNGDFTVCDKMTNKYMKESCQDLEYVSDNPGIW
jgi:hypothetical protein